MVKNYVRIQSDVTITVTGGLYYVDNTDAESHVADKLKISPTWVKATVDIKKGKGIYPAEIVNWPTVKNLEKDGLLTIGAFLEEPETEEEKAVKAQLSYNLNEIKDQGSITETKSKTKRLADIVAEKEKNNE